MPELPAIAELQCGVFAGWQAAAAEWTRSALGHALRSGRIHRLRVGAYQVANLADISEYEQARRRHAAPAIAAALTTAGAAASHSTAAVLHGLPLLFIPELPCVVVAPWNTGDVPHIHLHRCAGERWPAQFGAVGATSLERTLVDLAREHGVAAGVVPMDYALHARLTELSKLQAELDRCARWPGVRTAREALALADPLAESPLESRSRLKLREAGLPLPALQARIGNTRGRFVARVDFYWDEFGVVGEVDGAVKYDGSDPRSLHEEKLRQEAITELGLEVVRWGAADLRHFEQVAARLKRAFGRTAARTATDRRWTVLPAL